MWLPRLGEGRVGSGSTGAELQFGKMKTFRRRMVVMVAQHVNVLSATELYTHRFFHNLKRKRTKAKFCDKPKPHVSPLPRVGWESTQLRVQSPFFSPHTHHGSLPAPCLAHSTREKTQALIPLQDLPTDSPATTPKGTHTE